MQGAIKENDNNTHHFRIDTRLLMNYLQLGFSTKINMIAKIISLLSPK